MTEINLRKCKVCEQEKQRILKGKYPDGVNKRWVDQFDREWNGRVCPECHASKVKTVMRRIRG